MSDVVMQDVYRFELVLVVLVTTYRVLCSL